MDIVLYLAELLQTHKTIGIVGLGTLYKKKKPGRYDATQHLFLPPSYQIEFTTSIKEETALPNFISERRNITAESANYYINEFVENVQAQLADYQEADLGQIGKLKLLNDEIVFIANNAQDFGFEFFGLPTLPGDPENNGITAKDAPDNETLGEVEKENKLEEENPGNETTDFEYPLQDADKIENEGFESIHQGASVKLVDSQISSSENGDIIENTYELTWDESPEPEDIAEEEPKKRIPFLIKFMIVLLAIVALGAIAYFINPKFFDKYIQQNFESKPTRNVPAAPKDTLNNKIDSAKVDSLAKNNELVTLVKDSVVIDSSRKYYEVIGTSMTTKTAADKYIARVATRGIKATIAKMPGKRFNVSLGTFTEAKPALKLQDSLKKVLKDRGIYVQQIKPKK